MTADTLLIDSEQNFNFAKSNLTNHGDTFWLTRRRPSIISGLTHNQEPETHSMVGRKKEFRACTAIPSCNLPKKRKKKQERYQKGTQLITCQRVSHDISDSASTLQEKKKLPHAANYWSTHTGSTQQTSSSFFLRLISPVAWVISKWWHSYLLQTLPAQQSQLQSLSKHKLQRREVAHVAQVDGVKSRRGKSTKLQRINKVWPSAQTQTTIPEPQQMKGRPKLEVLKEHSYLTKCAPPIVCAYYLPLQAKCIMEFSNDISYRNMFRRM